MPGIVWIASYPKSGNTWVRVFLENYLRDDDAPASIDALTVGLSAASRHVFDEVVGIEASDLTGTEIAAQRLAVYQELARSTSETLFIKVHDAFRTPSAPALFPLDVTRGVVYVIRNPLDVAVSLAHHEGVSVELAIARLCGGTVLAPNGDRLREQLAQVLLSWSRHVETWVDESGLNPVVVPYESMLSNPVASFSRVVEAAGLELDEQRLTRAIRSSSFATLRSQEMRHGFRERPLSSRQFFRSGQSGAWRGVLTPDQERRIIDCHRVVMQRFGYLPADGAGAANGGAE